MNYTEAVTAVRRGKEAGSMVINLNTIQEANITALYTRHKVTGWVGVGTHTTLQFPEICIR